jgi:hypothetical protein
VATDRPTVYRPVPANRAIGVLGIALAWLGGRSVPDHPAWLVLVVGGVLLVGNLWRSATLTDTHLTVQGRWTRRRLALAEVTDCAVSTHGVPWVQGAEGAVEARMVAENYPAGQGPAVFLADVRSRASDAGALLRGAHEGPDDTRRDPDGPSTRVFSW